MQTFRSPSNAPAAGRNPVGCQTNAWQLAPGNFTALLGRVADLQRLGFQGFECNVGFVEDQYPNPKEARPPSTPAKKR